MSDFNKPIWAASNEPNNKMYLCRLRGWQKASKQAKSKNMKTTEVTKVSEDGRQSYYCTFENNYDAKYNLVTLCMQMHKNNNIWDKNERSKFEPMITEGKFSYFFEFGTDVYIILK